MKQTGAVAINHHKHYKTLQLKEDIIILILEI